MDWYTKFLILTTIQLVSSNYRGDLESSEKIWLQPPKFFENEMFDSSIEDGRIKLLESLLLAISTSQTPLFYIEDDPVNDDFQGTTRKINSVFKRSRYLRRDYPWKRQNLIYDSPSRYFCQPSKDEVFRLLLALQEARQENSGKIINFCNRKRPASTVFRNIRVFG